RAGEGIFSRSADGCPISITTPMRSGRSSSPLLSGRLSDSSTRIGRHRRGDVGLGEIVALEQQGFIGQLGKRVGEAVAIVEARRMTALAIAAPGATRLIGVLDLDRDNVDVRPCQPQIEFDPAGFAKARLQ